MPRRNKEFYLETHGEHGELCFNAVEQISALTKATTLSEKKRLLKCLRSWISKCYNETNGQNRYFRHVEIHKEWLENPQTFIDWCFADSDRLVYTLVRIDKSKHFDPENLIPRLPQEKKDA